MLLAWAVCAVGLGLGLAGCALMAAPPVRPRRTAWVGTVEATARECLAVARELAAGAINDVATTATHLDALAARLDELAAFPARRADAGQLVGDLTVAARGARAEAARLRNVIVVGSDRRAFVAALRRLRDIERAAVPAAAAAERAVTPSTLAG